MSMFKIQLFNNFMLSILYILLFILIFFEKSKKVINNSIENRNHAKFAKEWHKTLKRLCNYTNNKGLLDL